METSMFLRFFVALCALVLVGGPVAAQPFPSKTIRLIVPGAAGGIADRVARSLALGMAPLAGVPVVVENRLGASGIIGVGLVARAPADGYTLTVTPPDAVTLLPFLTRDMPYRPEKDLQTITMVADMPMIIGVSSKSPFKSLAEFVAAAKTRSAPMTIGNPGTGSSVHLAGELLAAEVGIKLLQVPYKGGVPAVTALVAGEVDIFFASIPLLKPFIDSGHIRPLAVGAKVRSSALPDVPTTTELGYPNVLSSLWLGVMGPAGMPKAVADRLHELIVASLPGVSAAVKPMGAEVRPTSLAESAVLVADDAARWKKLIDKLGLKPE